MCWKWDFSRFPVAAAAWRGEDLPWLCLPWTPELSKAESTSPGLLLPAEMQKWLLLQLVLLNIHLSCPKSSDCPQWQREGQADWQHSDSISACLTPQLSRDHLRKSWSKDALWALMVSLREAVYCWRSASAGACLVYEKLSYLAMQVDITNKACFSWQQTAMNWCNYLE